MERAGSSTAHAGLQNFAHSRWRRHTLQGGRAMRRARGARARASDFCLTKGVRQP
jgi:hypothetical protein